MCLDTYVTVKKNQNQICWKFKKVGGFVHSEVGVFTV
jgi:hypothetical protein